MNSPNATPDDFRREYEAALLNLVRTNPSEYLYAEADVPRIAEKMCKGLATGAAAIGPAAKIAAKKCGVKPTIKAIKDFLNSW